MATPTPSRSISTPKPHLPNTPSRMMASPRPGTAAGKTLAHKSPATATKTPASTHSHIHGLGVASQPSSTPLAAAAIHDELLNLNSPAAALINAIAQNGLTPLGNGAEGLGISAQGGVGTGRDGQSTRAPAEERIQRLQQAIDSLRSKVVGRGITRDGIERVARLHGFEALWDEDNLVIAGNVVEIEITFDSVLRDNVKDLSLKFNYNEEQHVQKEGTAILKAQSGVRTAEDIGQAKDLSDFADNIQYLAQLDPIDVKPNPFQLVSNLYQSFQDIWKEEKRRMHWRSRLQHLRKGALGISNMDHAPELGLTLGFWHEPGAASDAGEDETSDSPPSLGSEEGLWKGKISCEAGLPSLYLSKDWIGSKILTEGQAGQNVLDASDTSYRPDWTEFTNGLAIKSGEKEDTDMETEKPQDAMPQSLNVHFTFNLRPEVLLPLAVMSRLNSEISMVDIDPQKASTYHRVLQRARSRKLGRSEEAEVDTRWSRNLACIDSQGQLSYQGHSYKLYSAAPDSELWCYPISKLRFNHPRQIAEILPLLRQHVVVWSMLEKLVTQPAATTKVPERPKVEDGKRVFKRSNKVPAGGNANGGSDSTSLNIDIMLDVLSDPSKVRLELFAPLKRSGGHKIRELMLHVSILVKAGGVVEVTNLDGFDNGDLPGLRTKLSKMLTATVDIGMVLHWLLDKATTSS
ncbi:uncharacterized protein HMPREF1541_07667 [Cyphellophora europaea CBS 101466]|uniref:Mediator of RNA polymerase II transcription subunit 1 n=1 Tax=Cyphellophora europaea (strain CBS 101466) TaxID=1220924 RepID=W2RQQ0_CYPE1|nr:uncharacterized protein HMPREF1541_07667 [Cyphellophora europaea CBS 101466]ETN38044.1 hypothetical protein HMPREF1541_07667 [Cyphellophora europaea CBS 101466]